MDKEDFELKLSVPQPFKPSQPHKTLLDLAAEAKREITEQEKEREKKTIIAAAAAAAEVPVGRLTEAALWTSTFTMLHSTLDFLVTHQYATEVHWAQIFGRGVKVFPVLLLLTYAFHPHPSPPVLLFPLFPSLPRRFRFAVHQSGFFITSVAAGAYLTHTTNVHPYYAIMKQVPPLGCLWVWSMIELQIIPALLSIACCALFLKIGGYSLL